jgi:hypothetical protein
MCEATKRDGQAMMLMARASHALSSPPDQFDGVINLAGK